MNDLMHTHKFRSSRTKLVPAVIVLSAFAAPMTLLSVVVTFALVVGNGHLGFRSSSMANVNFGFIALYGVTAFWIWGVIYTTRRIINPDEIELNREGIRVTKLGRTKQYYWTDLGPPSAIRTSSKSMARQIRMRLIPSKWRNLRIPAEQYTHSVDDMLIAINNARNGIFEELPPESSLVLYRYFAIPMALLTAAALPALCVYLS